MEHLETTLVFVQKINKGEDNRLHFLEVPTLDFLLRKHIVPMNEEWSVDDEIQTNESLMSKTILFTNKIRISSAIEKLIVHQDMAAKQSLDDLQKIGVKLVDKIKDVEYAGVGINFVSIMESNDPGEEIKSKFLSSMPNIPISKVIGGSISYVYKVDETRATITISPVKRNVEGDGTENAISFSANYHFEVPYPKRIQDFIRKMPDFQSDYLEQSRDLFGQ